MPTPIDAEELAARRLRQQSDKERRKRFEMLSPSAQTATIELLEKVAEAVIANDFDFAFYA